MGKINKNKSKKTAKSIAKSSDNNSMTTQNVSRKKRKGLKRKREENEEINTGEVEHELKDYMNLESTAGDSGDEELSSDRDCDLMNDEGEEVLNFDFEAFPMEIDDREGIVNMLTQIFLRADIDIVTLADTIIKQSPFGNVIGPAEDNSDEDSKNVVYGLLTVIELNNQKTETSKYAKEILNFVLMRARNHAVKDVLKLFEEGFSKTIALFINERMLNFPVQIISPSFNSIRMDINGLKKPVKNVLYIHKLRIADASSDTKLVHASSTSSVPGKKKKIGKAEKKRQAAAALANAEIIYDNIEDELLMQVTEGTAHYFDYPVHADVESTSKFHTIEKDGKKFKPYRRAVIMDSQRFNAFLDRVANTSFRK